MNLQIILLVPQLPKISDDRPCATGGDGGEFGLGLLSTDGGWLVEDRCLDLQLFGHTFNGAIFNGGSSI